MNNTFEVLADLINKAFLTPRETDILIRRLEGQDLKSIGQNYGVTRERIRQIEGRACRKLKHHTRFGGIEGRITPKTVILASKGPEKVVVNETAVGVPIEQLELPIRVLNALKHGGYYFIHQLILVSDTKLYRLRNIGPDSIRLIRDRIDRWFERRDET